MKSLSASLKGKSSNHVGNFYCLNCFHSCRTKNRLKKLERVCNDHDYCYVEMSDEDNKILKYNHGKKSIRVPLIIYANLECLLQKMHSCQNNPEKTKYTPFGYPLFTNCLFDAIKKLDCYRVKDCIESFVKI